ncbi:uncharacterized protein LOC110038716 [Phalaenopsis equestris]|uniref:uncharacterized protein LOC110038716 n=1 Tax=Phalaenopsis equestris TaxID=78828 RepID=UPI0009E33D95|nr:uncharacterized protein LOC110038716 [Phalaenopsis equestris]
MGEGLKRPSIYHLCKEDGEFVSHLFFNYKFSQEVWNALIQHLKIDTMNLEWWNIFECWRGWVSINLGSIPFIAAWFLWYDKNQIIFDDIPAASSKVAANCLAFIGKLIQLKKFLNILRIAAATSQRKFYVIKVFWDKPPVHIVKVNTDGSYSSHGVGIGGVFRDHNGRFLLFY